MIYDPLKISRWTLFKTFKNLIAAVDWAVDRSHANSGLIGAEVGEKLVKMRWYLRGVLIVAIRYLSLSDACV